MRFEKCAYLFDSNMLGELGSSSVYCLMSMVGNPTVMYSSLGEILKGIDLQAIESGGLESWINDDARLQMILDLLSSIIKNKEKIEAYSFFIDRDFSNFLVCLGLILKNFDPKSPQLTETVNNMYLDFMEYNKGAGMDSSTDDLKFVNGFIAKWVKKNRQYQTVFELQENTRPMGEQSLLRILADKQRSYGIMVASDFYYTRFFSEFFSKRVVKDIYATPETGQRFVNVIKTEKIKNEFNVNLTFGKSEKENEQAIEQLARVLMMISEYAINRISSIDEVSSMSENDKLLFIMVWILFQGNENNWLMNKNIYTKIGILFNSVKKDLDV